MELKILSVCCLIISQCPVSYGLAPSTVGGVVANVGQFSNTLKVSEIFFFKLNKK